MNIQQQQRQNPLASSWELKQYEASIAQKFNTYDRNKDGILDKVEFRSLLKDVFSSQTSTQFLEDAIEEAVWRMPNVDLATAKQVYKRGQC
jgi:Ca2+-binding EF-hand superfamily protein